jgi:hypothetical protein
LKQVLSNLHTNKECCQDVEAVGDEGSQPQEQPKLQGKEQINSR